MNTSFSFFGSIAIGCCFISLCFSQIRVFSEVALLHCIIVLVDFFVMEFIFIPVCTMMWGKFNWWPKSPAVIYNQAAVADHGSQIMKFLVNGEGDIAEDDPDLMDDDRSYSDLVETDKGVPWDKKVMEKTRSVTPLAISETSDDFDQLEYADDIEEND